MSMQRISLYPGVCSVLILHSRPSHLGFYERILHIIPINFIQTSVAGTADEIDI